MDYRFKQLDNKWYFIPIVLEEEFSNYKANKCLLDLDILTSEEMKKLGIKKIFKNG